MDHPGRRDPSAGTIGGEQREALLCAKLTALVRNLGADHAAEHDSERTTSRRAGAADAHDSSVVPQVRGALTGMIEPGGAGFVLVEFGTPQAVAGAISWAAAQRCNSLTVFVDLDAGAAARYASYFGSAQVTAGDDSGIGDIDVRSVAGASSIPVTAEPLPNPIDPPEPPDDLIEIMREQGLEIVSEHGVIRGEIRGLEVARLVRWPIETGGDGQLHLEVGVGRFDRDAIWAVRDGTNMVEALADTAAMVRRYRRPGADPHPLGRLQRERWLRSVVVADPGLVGAATLEPVAMTIEAAGMKDTHPAGSVGRDPDGSGVVVVTSIGVDLSVMPLAADLRSSFDESARLVVAVPPADVHPVLGRLAGMLTPNAQIVPVPTQW